MKGQSLVLVALIALAGCGKPPSHVVEAAPPKLADDWKLATNDKYGLSVGVTPGWRAGSAPAFSGLGITSDMQQNDPNAPPPPDPAEEEKKAAKAELAQVEHQGILLICSDGSKTLPGEEPTRYVLKHVTAPGEMDFENGIKLATKEMSFAHDPQFVDLANGKAAKYTINFKNRGGDEIHEILFVLVDGKEIYELIFTCTGDDKIGAIADPVAQSLRIKPGLEFEPAS